MNYRTKLIRIGAVVALALGIGAYGFTASSEEAAPGSGRPLI